MLNKLKKFCVFTTKPKNTLEDFICDGKGWINGNSKGIL